MIPFILAAMVCGGLNWGYAYALGFGLIVVVAPLLRRRLVPINFIQSPAFWLLAAFGLSYAVLGGGSFDTIQNALILPLAAYAIGWCGFEQGGRKAETVRDGILAVALGFAAHAAANYFTNLGHGRAQLIDFWSGSYQTATGSGCLNTLVFALLIYTLFLEKRRGRKLLLLAATVVCFLYMLQLANRTQLAIALVLLPVSGVLLLWERRRISARHLLGLVLVSLLAVLCWQFDWFGLSEAIAQSNLAARFAERSGLARSNGERVAQFAAGLKNLAQNPFGGQKGQYYFHNMWLDIGRVSGLLPVVLMLAYNALTGRHVFLLFRARQLDAGTRYVLLCSYLGVMMNFFVEPVMEGLVSFFLAFCTINGLADALYRSTRAAEREKRESLMCLEAGESID